MKYAKTALIGAGNIAETHAAAIRAIPGIELTAVVDANFASAAAFARRWGIRSVYDDLKGLIAAGSFDVAHVLVPPMMHKDVATPLLEAGIPVFLEKPMAQATVECETLQRSAVHGKAALRINHNFVHHPAHRQIRALLGQNHIGPVRHIQLAFNMPLRQLQARQLGHWMFNTPRNLLLEQAVHPLSQIDDLLGMARLVEARAMPPLRLGDGQEVVRKWLVSLECDRGTAQLHFSLGESYPLWMSLVIGDDGMILADYANNRVVDNALGPHMALVDSASGGVRMGCAAARQSLANFISSSASMLKLLPRSDPFFQSMKSSIEAFYHDLERSTGDLIGTDGLRMVELCEKIAATGHAPHVLSAPPSSRLNEPHDILVVGGTGFIGQELVRGLVARGRRVAVLARNIDNLPDIFNSAAVSLIRGNARDAESVARAIGRATSVVNLAHGGGGGSRAETEASLVGAARTVAECCIAQRTVRLIFVSSIAALYLGDAATVVTGETPPDPEYEKRADYARAKVLAERAMLALQEQSGLRVVILRPGIVVGAGGLPFHSGFGFYNHERHCLGWNRGVNPLPLVLVSDVADAIVSAIDTPGIDGKSYNLVGGVRLTAGEYIDALADATKRPLLFHPQSVLKLYAIECFKAVLKHATGRGDGWPSLRDLKSRGLVARFDCSDAARELGWNPVTDRKEFMRLGISVHAANR